MQLDKILSELGLSQKETKIYLAVLESGEAPLTQIAKNTAIPRTSCYGLIENLIEKGFVTYMVKRRKKYYFAENPDHLLKQEEKKGALLKEALPRFKALYNISGVKPKIRFYEGVSGIKQILQEIINEKRDFLAITSIEDANTILHGDFGDFIGQRIKHNLRVRLLTGRTPAALKLKKTDGQSLRDTRFISGEYHFKTANFKFGSKLAIISLKKNPLGIVIEDDDITDTFKMYFEILWKGANAE